MDRPHDIADAVGIGEDHQGLDAEFASVKPSGVKRFIDLIDHILLGQVVENFLVHLQAQKPRLVIDLFDIPPGDDLVGAVDQRNRRAAFAYLDQFRTHAQLHFFKFEVGFLKKGVHGRVDAIG